MIGSELQTVGPATAKTRRPNVLRRCRGNDDWQSRDAGDQRRERLVCSSPSGTEELYVVDSDARSHLACTSHAHEHPDSRGRRDVDEISRGRTFLLCCRIQYTLKRVSRRLRRSNKHRDVTTKACASDCEFMDSGFSDRWLCLSWRKHDWRPDRLHRNEIGPHLGIGILALVSS